jgi:hypothetical protein
VTNCNVTNCNVTGAGLLGQTDALRGHGFYIKAAMLAVECYLSLHDTPYGSKEREAQDAAMVGLSPAELKKLVSKQKKAAKKAVSIGACRRRLPSPNFDCRAHVLVFVTCWCSGCVSVCLCGFYPICFIKWPSSRSVRARVFEFALSLLGGSGSGSIVMQTLTRFIWELK